MRAKKKKKKLEEKRVIRYIPLDDIKEINDAFLTEMERVKQRLMTIKDPDIIAVFHGVLLSAYNAAIAIKTFEREVDYDIKLAETEARADELRPEQRRHWYWLFRTFPNRAQDIIEERAELEAERVHSELEKLLDDDWACLFPKKEKLSKRELRRQAKKQLKAAIKKADETPTNEAFDEPAAPTPALMHDIELEQAQPQPKQTSNIKPAKQLAGQMTLDDVQPQENAVKPVQVHKARPPRSCRK